MSNQERPSAERGRVPEERAEAGDGPGLAPMLSAQRRSWLRTLHGQLTVGALLVTTVLCVVWFAAIEAFCVASARAEELERQATHMRARVAEMRLGAREIVTASRSGRSLNAGDQAERMRAHAAAVTALRAAVRAFEALALQVAHDAVDRPGSDRELEALTGTYEAQFTDLVAGLRALGGKGDGATGALESTGQSIGAAILERSAPELRVAWARVHLAERELTGRSERTYGDRLNAIRTQLAEAERVVGAAADATDLVARLGEYRARLDGVALAQQRLGVAGGGLQDAPARTARRIDQVAIAALLWAERLRETAAYEQSVGTVALALGLLLFATLGSYLVARSITRPVVALKDAALAVADGRLDGTLGRRGRGELGVLQTAFRSMIAALADARRELTAGAERVEDGVAQIAASSSQVAAATSETSAAMTEAVASADSVKDRMRETAELSRHVSEISQSASGVAASGRSAAGRSIQGLERIAREMDSITEGVRALDRQSQRIGTIISQVNDLTERSNLLAVNASVEAAKAGDEGRGFVNVADEIKELAGLSKDATDEVRTILSTIRKGAGAAVQAARRGLLAVDRGLHQAGETVTAIDALGGAVEDVAVEAQEIADSVQQIDVSVNLVFTALDSVLAATREHESVIGDVDGAVRDLERTAGQLAGRARRHQLEAPSHERASGDGDGDEEPKPETPEDSEGTPPLLRTEAQG